ncbi:hypothetical protein [Oribacterium sp. P9]|uniref:hypothetical protein n=1 Tax=Oribacterium sp. P9 TaxID=3378068 RepID=UPI003967B959
MYHSIGDDDFYHAKCFSETPVPGVSFCLPAYPELHALFIYILNPPHAGKQKFAAVARGKTLPFYGLIASRI